MQASKMTCKVVGKVHFFTGFILFEDDLLREVITLRLNNSNAYTSAILLHAGLKQWLVTKLDWHNNTIKPLSARTNET